MARQYLISGNSINDVDYTRTQTEAVIRNSAAVLIAGNEYAVKLGKYHGEERMVFVGKVFERTTCWNGTGEKCTYKGHLLFALERDNHSRVAGEKFWIPVTVASNLIWGDWEPYRKSVEEAEAKRRKERAGTIKHNAQMIKEVRDALVKLGLKTDGIDHRSPDTDFQYQPEHFSFWFSGVDLIKAAKELKKK
jgi:hypothetical protein